MSQIKVLLVDDEVGFTASMKRLLRNRGFDVKEASDGLTAMSLIGSEHFDVIVLDIKMPGMDGIQVLAEISRFSPDSRVILLTGHYSSGEEEKNLRRGVFAYLLKPYPILELVDILIAAAQSGNICPLQPTKSQNSA
jgi:DNA-binding NtrC family response regulator